MKIYKQLTAIYEPEALQLVEKYGVDGLIT